MYAITNHLQGTATLQPVFILYIHNKYSDSMILMFRAQHVPTILEMVVAEYVTVH